MKLKESELEGEREREREWGGRNTQKYTHAFQV